jgi:hypothetical protein
MKEYGKRMRSKRHMTTERSFLKRNLTPTAMLLVPVIQERAKT